ncbi:MULTISPECIES: acetyl-CoA acetyltransferase [Delftia]|jgi:acetyl-CoA C-acetyltransferase|uniref:Acetyl-CoA acetyltransferase n=1 Tax=Delftia lacustris TaxID=558537 RepID=A0A7T2YWD8_9BURK|nr:MULTISPECIES: acetyl-CoA acetyltransferase [Delftia]KAA9167249.1 acetyl-CoA acetyltransferase [Delftia sp. BR1]EPD40969.1 acetyl-CoA C-acetyltransferase [Delftia acidovorans CCUG 15835]MCO5340278.1 acetyl-CoA acetyltransferase [Delftia tsuruhatensis]MCR4545771.1 acetyl-CoA acetyltransferase [Delftia tsuruhatensis]MDC2858750.1 acetyl-CoA acetyltransferase [Delftia sp. DT-2]
MNPPRIIGWGHTPFGKHAAADAEQLLRDAIDPALQTAGLEPRDIDGIFVGHFNGGLLPQDFSASLVALAVPELRHVPATRSENACATGSAAIWAALDAVQSGRIRCALVVGFEIMNAQPGQKIAEILLRCSYVKEEAATPAGFAGVFGQIATRYFERFGDQSDALAAIAAKNHANGVHNPFAHMRRDLGLDFCRHASDRNPFVAGPLKRSDCSLVSDGAAALVISRQACGNASVAPVRWRSRTQVNDLLPLSRRDPTRFEGAALAWQRGLADAGATLADLGFVETHDCFTMAELLEYEAMGLAPHGQGARAILDGSTCRDGWLPVNPSGGLKSRGHPIGATGVSQHVMAAMQLSGSAGAMQLPAPRLGAVFNMGGAAVANYLSVLEAA